MFLTMISEGMSTGTEGSTYALLTSISNLGYVFGGAIGNCLTKIWDVSNPTLEKGDFIGMAKLTILLSFVHVAPLALVWLLPDTKEEQRALRDEKVSNFWGGFWLTFTIFVSIACTLALDLYFVYEGEEGV